MTISFTGSPASPQLALSISVGDEYPAAAPKVQIIGFTTDKAGDAFVLYVSPPVPPGQAPQGPILSMDALSFIQQNLP